MPSHGSASRPVVLLLAAGRSSRFGSDKRRATVAEGTQLLQLSVVCYRQTGLDLVLCLSARSGDDELESRFSVPGVRVLRCDAAEQGMGGTLAQGVQACPPAPGIFVALGDMPLVREDTLRALEEAFATDRIVVPYCRGRRGHPVLFGRDYYDALATLGGDRGASSLLAEKPGACTAIEVRDPGIFTDVDRSEDLVAARRALQSRSAAGVSG